MDILTQIEEAVENYTTTHAHIFMCDLKVNRANHILISIDSDHDVSVQECNSLLRHLHMHCPQLGNDYSIEVGSAGKNIRLPRQFTKNIGRNIKIKTEDEETLHGKIVETNTENVSLSIKDEKKKTEKVINIPYTNIKQATIQFVI